MLLVVIMRLLCKFDRRKQKRAFFFFFFLILISFCTRLSFFLSFFSWEGETEERSVFDVGKIDSESICNPEAAKEGKDE